MKLEFVSDVACPWCAIGLAGLEQALERLRGDLEVEFEVQPFELNPGLPPEGEGLADYMARKYGIPASELAPRRQAIRQRAAQVGLAFGERARVWNTFDAHRLLHWAGLEGRQRELKRELLSAYHERGANPGAREVLLDAAAAAGLDPVRAAEVIDTGRYAAEVRERIDAWRAMGIGGVPALVVERRWLIEGAQTPDQYERALREMAKAAAAPA